MKTEKYLKFISILAVAVLVFASGFYIRNIFLSKEIIKEKPSISQEKEVVIEEEKQLTTFPSLFSTIYDLSWRPNSQKIVFTFEANIWVINEDGSNLKQLTKTGRDARPQHSPDEKKLIFAESNNIWVMDSDGNNKKQLTKEGGWDPSWSPDSKKITYVSEIYIQNKGWMSTLWVMDSDGTNQKQLITNLRRKRNPAFSPDGEKILFEASEEDAIYFESYDLPNELWIIDKDGGNQRQLAKGLQGLVHAKSSWSPNGKKIAVNLYLENPSEIWVIDVETGDKEQLSEGAHGATFSWSPDGKKIVYEGREKEGREGNFFVNLFVVDIDGKNQKQLTFSDEVDSNPVWSPDGKKIVFTRHNELWLIKIK